MGTQFYTVYTGSESASDAGGDCEQSSRPVIEIGARFFLVEFFSWHQEKFSGTRKKCPQRTFFVHQEFSKILVRQEFLDVRVRIKNRASARSNIREMRTFFSWCTKSCSSLFKDLFFVHF